VGVTAWEDEPLQRLFRHGFAACVGKSVSREELASVIERVMGGDCSRVAEPQPAIVRSNPFDQLTGREMQVFLLLLAGARPADIATRLFISVKTVHTFRYRILEKLRVATDIELARLATQHGLMGSTAPDRPSPIIGA
jgi:two-component system invasion response regulator UvrY